MKRLFLSVLALGVFGPGFSQSLPAESYPLNSCAIIQMGDHPRVYLTHSSGEVEAVDVFNGKVLWHNAKASFALLARGNRLLVSLPPEKGKIGCRVGILDARSGRFLSKLPEPSGDPLGCVGEGISGSFHIEGIAKEGRDYLVWTKKWWPVPGGAYMPNRVYPPGSSGTTRGAFEVDWVKAKLTAVPADVPETDVKYQPNPKGGYRNGPFVVDGQSFQTSMELVGNQFHLVLRRWKGLEALPDVLLGEPPWNSCGIVISTDRRNVLGVYQVPDKTNPFLYHVGLYSTATGEKEAELDATSWPSVAQVCGDKLVAFFPNRVFAIDIRTGKEIWTRSVKDLSYRGSYPPAARPPTAR